MPVKGSSNGGFYGIMEFLRNEDDSPFYDEDEEIVNSYMGGFWNIKLNHIKLIRFYLQGVLALSEFQYCNFLAKNAMMK